MPFTREELQQIDREKKAIYKESCKTKKEAMLVAFNRIKENVTLPLPIPTTEEELKYKTFIQNINDFLTKVETLLLKDVPSDEYEMDTLAKNDEKLRDLFNATTNQTALMAEALIGERVREENVPAENAEDAPAENVENAPAENAENAPAENAENAPAQLEQAQAIVVHDSSSLNVLFAQLQDINHMFSGSNYKDPAFVQASEVLSKLRILKQIYESYDAFGVSKAKTPELNMALTQFKEPEKDLKRFVKNACDALGYDFDFTKIDEFLTAEKEKKQKLEAQRRELEKKIIAETDADQKILKLSNEFSALQMELDRRQGDARDIDIDRDHLGETMYDLKREWIFYQSWVAHGDNLRKERHAIDEQIADDKATIESHRISIKTYENKLKEEAAALNLDKKTKKLFDEAFKVVQELTEAQEYLSLINDKEKNAFVKTLLIGVNYKGNDQNEFYKQIDKNLADLKDSTRAPSQDPFYQKSVLAAHYVRNLIMKYQIKPSEIRDLAGPGQQKIIEDLNKTIDTLDKKRVQYYNALLQSGSPKAVECINYIKYHRIAKLGLMSLSVGIKNLEKKIKENTKLSSQKRKEREDHLKKMPDDGLSKHLENAYAKLDDICTDKAYGGKLDKTYATYKKRPNIKIDRKGQGKLEDYQAAYKKLLEYEEEVSKFLANERKTTAVENIKIAQEAVSKKSAEIAAMKDKIKQSKMVPVFDLSRKIDLCNTKINKAKHVQLFMVDKYNSFSLMRKIYNDLDATHLVTEVQQAFKEQFLRNEALAIYRQLNDARVWWNDSDHYKAMIDPLCEMVGHTRPTKRDTPRDDQLEGKGPDFDKIPEILQTMKAAAQAYIVQKGEAGMFPTKQRDHRLSIARQIIAMCENTQLLLDQLNNDIVQQIEPTANAFITKTDAHSDATVVTTEEGNVVVQPETFGHVLNRIAKVEAASNDIDHLEDQPKGIFGLPDATGNN